MKKASLFCFLLFLTCGGAESDTIVILDSSDVTVQDSSTTTIQDTTSSSLETNTTIQDTTTTSIYKMRFKFIKNYELKRLAITMLTYTSKK